MTIAFPVDSPKLSADCREAIDGRHRDMHFHCAVTIPSDWKQIESPRTEVSSATDFIETVRFAATNDLPYVSIAVLELPRECGASEWLSIDQQRRGHDVVQRRDSYSQAGSVPDVLTTRRLQGQTLICRTTALKDGHRLLRLECCARESEYEEYAADFLNAVLTFRLLKPTGVPYAESIQAIAIGDEFQISAPKSWRKVNETVGSLDDPRMRFVELESKWSGEWTGSLFIARTVKDDSAADNLRLSMMMELRQRGLDFSRVNIGDVKSDSAELSGIVFEPEFVPASSDNYAATGLILSTDEHVVLISILGPSESADPEWYAINKRAFEIVRDSITVAGLVDTNANFKE